MMVLQSSPHVLPPRTLVLDEHFHLFGEGIHSSSCHVRVFSTGQDMIVVFTKDKENPGANVTNTVEQIASELLPHLVTSPDKRDIITWIEHCEEGALPDEAIAPIFDRVTFENFISVPRKLTPFGHFTGSHRQRISQEDVERMVGSGWPAIFPADLCHE